MLNEQMKKSILFLWLNDKEFYALNAKRRGVQIDRVFKNKPLIHKIFRRFLLNFNVLPISYWLESWSLKLERVETIIIHASKLTPHVVKYIYQRKPSIKIIVWYWNPISKSIEPNSFSEKICERWTFDRNDSNEFNINFNTQYYFNDLVLDNHKIIYDIYFLGADKGRLKMLIELERKFKSLGLITNFHITKTSNNYNFFYKFKKRISYEENLIEISKSKAILDIVSEGQSGLTLRPLESIFLKKKLITNDKKIIENDFYFSENIFIVGVDNPSDLISFLNSSFKEIPKEILNNYDFESWLHNFFN